MRARDIMTKELAWVRGDNTALEASDTMRSRDISSVLVEPRDSDDTWGILTLSDVVKRVVETGRDPRTVQVHEIMSKPLVLIDPSLSVTYCAQLMERTDVRRLPVFDGEGIVGIVSHRDIVRSLIHAGP